MKPWGFLTRRDEEWKYTDVRAIAQGNFALPETADFSQAQAAALTLPLDAYRLTFVDGVFSAALSDLEALPSSVQVVLLEKALADNH